MADNNEVEGSEEVGSAPESLKKNEVGRVVVRKNIGDVGLKYLSGMGSVYLGLEKYRVPIAAAEAARKLTQGFKIPQAQIDAVWSGIPRGFACGSILSAELARAVELHKFFDSVALGKTISNATLAAKVVDFNSYRLPYLEEISKFGKGLILPKGFENVVSDSGRFLSELESQMGKMQSPWLSFENTNASMQAFAEMQALGVAVNGGDPFSIKASKFLRSELGDWRDPQTIITEQAIDSENRSALYIEKGFNRGLSEFSRSAFDEALCSAGIFDMSIPILGKMEKEEDLDSEGLARNARAFNLLMVFEIKVRRFINESMRAYYGDAWFKQQLPADMLGKWREKAEMAIKNGAKVGDFELIDYADFTDYKIIIERKDNWNAVFKFVFVRIENIRESFQRLFPVRIATMYARIITQEDEIFLFSETRRVINAINSVNVK